MTALYIVHCYSQHTSDNASLLVERRYLMPQIGFRYQYTYICILSVYCLFVCDSPVNVIFVSYCVKQNRI